MAAGRDLRQQGSLRELRGIRSADIWLSGQTIGAAKNAKSAQAICA
jgi:hypothetical protein